jgi:MFS family permease
VFFWLWLGVVCSSIGTWGQTVGAQWLFVNDPHATTIVPLVQTASTLPMMLLALPAGVLADAFDRRWMLLTIQVYTIVVAVLLAVLTAAGMMPPALLLAFVFAAGAGMAMNSPTCNRSSPNWSPATRSPPRPGSTWSASTSPEPPARRSPASSSPPGVCRRCSP